LAALDKRYKVWYTAKLSEGGKVLPFVMSKTGGAAKVRGIKGYTKYH
jgi:hypothetical protein